MYVTLEPCDHFGRTPPCTDAVIKSGIKRVVIAMKDPNPINNGRGIKKLRRNGIRVQAGVLRDLAEAMNEPYIKFITKKMPYVTVKVAQSLDGKIATRTGESKWISSAASRRHVQRLRGAVDAIMVGANTVIRDDPRLTNRSVGGAEPLRIAVCGRRNVPSGAKMLSAASGGKAMIALPESGQRVNLRRLLKKLAKAGIVHILVEGGGELIASLIEERLVDKILFFMAPKIIGGRQAKTAVEGIGVTKVKDALDLKDVKITMFDKDILVEGRVS